LHDYDIENVTKEGGETMSQVYQLLMPSRILYGRGAFNEVGSQARLLGNKVLIISDPVMEQLGNVTLCEEHLRKEALPFAKYTGVDTE
jgi:alcohol dehydrogenase class IV